jgi:DNA excision repair protein ERCC-4
MSPIEMRPVAPISSPVKDMTLTDIDSIILIEDSREQVGWASQGLFQAPYVRTGLSVGDYSILGLESLIAIERKSLPDLINSCTNDRTRFESELKRSRHLHKFYVICECSASDLLVESFGRMSRANPKSVWATAMAWSSRYAPFLFAENQKIAARWTESLLVAYAREFFKQTQIMSRSAKKAASDAA